MDTFSMIDDDPTLPIDFDQSTNLIKYLTRDKKDGSEGLHLPGILSNHEDTISLSETESKPGSARNDPNSPDRGTMRDHEEIIGALKKENFGLKLRIYFLEERLQMAYEGDTEDILKTNIELKVNIEQLKKDFTEKQNLLIKASKAMETISVESEKHINNLKDEFTKQFNDMRDQLQSELDQRDKEIAENHAELEELNKKILETEQVREELQRIMKNPDEYAKIIDEMQLKHKEVEEKYEKEIQEKDLKIQDLLQGTSNQEDENEIKDLKAVIAEKDAKILSLQDGLKDLACQSPDRSNQHFEVLYNKLEAENIENENKIKELAKDLRTKTNLVQELKDYINKTDRVNKELRNSIHDKETEKHRSSMSLQEHIRWKLNNRLRDLLSSVRLDLALSNKDKEINKYRDEIQKLENLLKELQAELGDAKGKLKEFDSVSSKDKSEALAALMADLQEKDFILKKKQQALLEKDKDLQFFNNSKLRAEQDFQNLIAQKNIDIKSLTEDVNRLTTGNREKMLALEDHCQRVQEDAQMQLNMKDKLIQRLSNALRNKDLLIQELASPLESLDMSSENLQEKPCFVLQKLRAKIKDLDRVIEANLDDKFKAINEKDQELLELKRALRGKDREMDSLKANVSACEEVIKHLEGMGKEKDTTLQGLKAALELQGNAFKVSSEVATNSIQDCQLKIIQLTSLLDVKEKEVTNDGNHKDSNTENLQKLVKDLFKMIARSSDEKNASIKQLKNALQQTNGEVIAVDNKLLQARKDFESSEKMLQENGSEKDAAIQELVKSGQEKDRLISELHEHIQTRPRLSVTDWNPEIASLKELCEKLKDELREKKETIDDIKQENTKIRDELDNQQRSENIEITLKFDNLKTDLEKKEKQLKEAREKVEELQQERDASIDMQRLINSSKDLQDTLHKLQEQKVHLEQRLKDLHAETNSLKASKDSLEEKLAGSSEVNGKLYAEIEDLKAMLQSSTSGIETEKLRSEIQNLKSEIEKERALPKRDSQLVGSGDDEVDSSDVKELLKQQLQQQKELLKATEQERLKYHKLITELNNKNRVPSPTNDLQFELESVSSLRSQYEKGLRQNETLREHLENEIKSFKESKRSADHIDANEEEILQLRSQLEESERWNKSLQSRLDQMSPRSGGVGGSRDRTDSSGRNPFEADITVMIERLQTEREDLQERLKKQQAECSLLRKELREGGSDADEAKNELNEFKLHYERFSQLRNKEITTLTDSCNEAKSVIKNMENEIAALNAELKLQKRLQQEDGDDNEAVAKQMLQIDEVNKVLRNELNERIGEIKTMKEKARTEQEHAEKLKENFNLLEDDKMILMNQIKEKNEEIKKFLGIIDDLKHKAGKFDDEKSLLEKKLKDFSTVQQDRNELRALNERLRNKLGEVSKTYENLKGTNDGEILALKEELTKANARIEELKADNEEANAITTRLRDEIRNLQEASRNVQRLTDELRNSENISKVLQRQLNDVAKASELRKNTLDPEIELIKQRMQEFQRMNADLQERLREYVREVQMLKNELSKERSVSLVEKNRFEIETRRLADELSVMEETKNNLERHVRELSYINETYKGMIESLEEQNKKKEDMTSRLEKELSRQKVYADIATSMTPQKTVNVQTTPTRPTINSTHVQDLTLYEAIQKRDAYIAAMRQQLEFYKQEKQLAVNEKHTKDDEAKEKTDNLIAAHIEEMRELRKELEQSIRNNDALRTQLEHRLSQAEKEAAQFKDPQMRASLLRENDSLRARINEKDSRIETLKIELETIRKAKDGPLDVSSSRRQIMPKDFESTRIDYDQMQKFAPQETSSALTSPLNSITAFTQTTPRKPNRNQETQADTYIAQITTEKQELQIQIDSLKQTIKSKNELIRSLEQMVKKFETEGGQKNSLRIELEQTKMSLAQKNQLVQTLEFRLNDLQNNRRSLLPTESQSIGSNASKPTSDELIALHISEMRDLKKELELSIKNNDSLRSQLEHRLKMVERDAEYIKDPQLRTHVIRDNDILRTQTIERQSLVMKQKTKIEELMKEKLSDKEKIKKLHQQIHDLNKLTSNLQQEVHLYDRLQEQLNATAARNKTISSSPGKDSAAENATGFDASLLQMLLEEIRILRTQLQKSIDANIALREKLEQQLESQSESSKITSANTERDTSGIVVDPRANTIRRALFGSEIQQGTTEATNNPPYDNHRYVMQETPTKENGSPGAHSYLLSPASLAAVFDEAKKQQVFVRGKIEDYITLKNKLANCCQRVVLMQDLHAVLQMHKSVHTSQINDLRAEADKISLDLKECRRLLDLMTTEEISKNDEGKDMAVSTENQQLKCEIVNLKKKLSHQDKLIKSSLQRLEESNKFKGDLERKILEKLKTTHGTMIKASQNLEDKIVKAKTPTK